MRMLAAGAAFMLLASGAEAQDSVDSVSVNLAHEHALDAALYLGDAVDLILSGRESKLPLADPSETNPLTVREMIQKASLDLFMSAFWIGQVDCSAPLGDLYLSMSVANRAYLDFVAGDLPARSRYLNSLDDELARGADLAGNGATTIRARC